MSLKRIRLELARNAEFPHGSPDHGYEFIAPLDAEGLLDRDAWASSRGKCTVRRFWRGEDDEHGHLVHHRGGNWAFLYDEDDIDDEEPIFKFDRHHFIPGEYVSITEHDGVQRTFAVVAVT